MKWIAALPMYNVTPALAADWRTLLRVVRVHMAPWLAARGDTLDIVEAGTSLEDFWLRDDLLLSQTCGYPLVNALAGRVQLVATPAFNVDGGANGDYRSVLVANRRVAFSSQDSLDAFRGLRAAFNSPDSNSGMNLLRNAIAPLAGFTPFFGTVIETGSHLASLDALTNDRADIAAIDCVTMAFVRDQLPELAAGVVEIGVTKSAPGLPMIASKALPPDGLAALAIALDTALEADGALARRLKLTGFVRRPHGDYGLISRLEADAVNLGYPRLA